MCSLPREHQKADHDDDINWEPPVRGKCGRDPETRDPLDEGIDASCCGSILDGIGGGPTC